MRLLRVQMSARKTVIYHPSFADVWNRLRCVFGGHRYETVLEYPSVGAKEEMCLHCMKVRHSLNPFSVAVSKTSSAT